MKNAFQAADVARFATLIVRRLGLQFDDGKLDLLAQILRQRLDAVGSGDDAGGYLDALESGAGPELGALAEQLTVGETYFFRNRDQLRACVEHCLPERQRALAGRRPLRVLSAGSASGEEAYSLAIMTREQLEPPQLLAIDLNPAAIAKALRGRYSDWSLRETPDAVRERYFRGRGRELELAGEIRALVRFEERNLVDDAPDFWRPDSFDVVFCRNVLMYFSTRQARAVVARIQRALVPGGYLFLGHAETLRDLSHDFHLRHTHATFYYQSFGSEARRARSAEALPAGVAAPGASWVDAIRTASERIATLTRTPAPRLPTSTLAATVTATPASWASSQPLPVTPLQSVVRVAARPAPLAVALELLQNERFAEALDHVRALPPSERDADTQLLHAVLLTHNGDLAEAQTACRRLLVEDELNAGARYLMALLCEQLGDFNEAIEHDLAAAYLDPRFAMPRLHLGLLARRAGERTRADDELGRALELLAREEASRILLFGGGFSREALIELCRAELRGTERRP